MKPFQRLRRAAEVHCGAGITIVLILVLLWCPPARSQYTTTQVELSPPNPSSNDILTFRLGGAWPNGCVPQSPKMSVSGAAIRIETSNPGAVCIQILTPWVLSASIGELAPGDYSVVVTYSGPSVSSTTEIARKSFSVTPSSLFNEVILPIVVNGGFSGKLHYQTIFTVLNTAAQSVRARLRIYSSTGTQEGVFCSPLAPPPSSASFTLNPGALFTQFTSADLPYLDGWASLTWEGPSSLLASEELTLVSAPPSPCLLICNRPSTEKLSSSQISALRPAQSFRFPATLNRHRQTGLAIINPSASEAIRVRVSILDAAGENAKLGVPDSFELKIGPLQRISKFLWQMALEHSALTVILPVPDSFQGSVVLTSDRTFAVGALNIMFPEGKFVSIPCLADSR